jgi:hypothetical protein
MAEAKKGKLLMKLVYFKIGRWESILSPLPSF